MENAPRHGPRVLLQPLSFLVLFFFEKKGTKGKRASREQPTILTLWLRQMMTVGVERLAVRSATRD